MLKTEQHTEKMRKAVLCAARKILHVYVLQADFEHRQWWISNPKTGAQYSVCDAEGKDTVNGFSLEQVTEAEE